MLPAGIWRKSFRRCALALPAVCASLLAAAPVVGAAAGGLTWEMTPSGIRALLSPIVSGTPAVGQTLSCVKGIWVGGSPLEYAYQWLRDGDPIKGDVQETYVVGPADRGHGLSCEVTASGAEGRASAKSQTLIVPAASALLPSSARKIEIPTSTVVVFAGAARIRIGCTGAPCSGTLELTERIVLAHRHEQRTTARSETLILGRGRFSLAAGQRGVCPVRLTKTAKHMLALAGHHSLPAVLGASVVGGQTVKKAVQLSQAHRAR